MSGREMKAGWEYKKIKDIGSVIAGTTPNTNVAEYWNGNLCWISPAELDGSHYLYDSRKKITEAAVKAKSLRLLPEGTVILSSRAPIGKVVINKIPTYCNQGFKCVVCGEEVYNEFLYWWFWGKTEYLNSLGTGATFKEISKKVVEEILIPVPPLSEQQRIVDYLDTAFVKIDAMKANAEKALNEAQALFQASLKEMLEPKEGWVKDELINVFNFIDYRGATPKKLDRGIPLITAKNVKYGYIDYTIKDFISKEEYDNRKSRGISHKGDILFTTEAPLGNVALADLEEFSAGQRLITLQQYEKPKYSLINEFYYYYILGPSFQKRIKELATGATAQGIKAKLLKTVVVPIPPLSEQQSIVAILDSLKSKVDHLQSNFEKISQECDSLKQALLRQVFE